jgi:tRNA (uracil-5-)-methyltransferase
MRDSWLRPSDDTAGKLTRVEQDGEPHVCIRDHHAIVREQVGNTLFEFPANSFFQNSE